MLPFGLQAQAWLFCRDVKLENLLLSEGRLKVADFGLAVDLAEEQPRVRVGTIDYNAPEVGAIIHF